MQPLGQSTPVKNWYYAQKKVGTWTVKFSLSHTYSDTGHLTVALAGASRVAQVTVGVNGTSVGSFSSYANDQAIYRSANQSGIYHLILLSFPASRLKAGANTVTFHATKISNGGGPMYETVKLEIG